MRAAPTGSLSGSPSRSLIVRVFALALLVGVVAPVARVGSRARRPAGDAGRVRRRAPDADQPWLRMAHRRRRQPQRARRGVVPEAGRDDVADGDAAAAPARRAGVLAQHLQPGGAEHVRRQHPRPRAGHRLRGALRAHRSRWHAGAAPATRPAANATICHQRDEGRHGADAARADAGHRRQGVSRLPGEMAGAEDRAGVRRHHVRLQLLLRRRRHRAGRAPARQAGRHRPRARRPLRLSLRVLREPDHRQRHDDVRRNVLPDGRRHARRSRS